MGLARLHITPEALLSLLHGRYEVVAHRVPPDATIHTCIYDEARHCLVVIVEHPEFMDVPPGRILPILASPTIRRLESQEPAP